VLCVFTTGQAWQFKPYKWTEPKDLFRNGEFRLLFKAIRSSEMHLGRLPILGLRCCCCRTVLGVYFHLSTEPQHPATKEWNVKPFKVSLSTSLISISFHLRLGNLDRSLITRLVFLLGRSTRNIDIRIDRSSARSGRLWRGLVGSDEGNDGRYGRGRL